MPADAPASPGAAEVLRRWDRDRVLVWRSEPELRVALDLLHDAHLTPKDEVRVVSRVDARFQTSLLASANPRDVRQAGRLHAGLVRSPASITVRSACLATFWVKVLYRNDRVSRNTSIAAQRAAAETLVLPAIGERLSDGEFCSLLGDDTIARLLRKDRFPVTVEGLVALADRPHLGVQRAVSRRVSRAAID